MDLMQIMPDKAEMVAGFLKGLANPSRLLILCTLTQGERSVTELIAATGVPQTSMSQHLSKLKTEGIVEFRREHRGRGQGRMGTRAMSGSGGDVQPPAGE